MEVKNIKKEGWAFYSLGKWSKIRGDTELNNFNLMREKINWKKIVKNVIYSFSLFLIILIGYLLLMSKIVYAPTI
jgi:formate/nitrite transporter FocA (FNT family)